MTDEEWNSIFSLIGRGELDQLEPILDGDNGSEALKGWDNSGMTALRFAVESGSVAAVRYLLGRGADPNQLDQRLGYTPLYNAVDANQLEIAKELLRAGAVPELCLHGLSSAKQLAEDNRLDEFCALFRH